jgi:hypothetical protein
MNKGKKPGVWKIVAAAISVLYIIYMWSQKDIEALSATVSPQELPMVVVTTIAVTVAKVALLALVLWLLRWGSDKLKKRK